MIVRLFRVKQSAPALYQSADCLICITIHEDHPDFFRKPDYLDVQIGWLG